MADELHRSTTGPRGLNGVAEVLEQLAVVGQAVHVQLGIGLVDMVPSGVSSAYVYYDPDWLDRSPGTFSALSEIQLAQRLGLPYVYLGYWITGCRSSEYKNRFRPYETLIGRPDDDETPVWIRSDAPSTELKSSSE